jgi:hypothetical protein
MFRACTFGDTGVLALRRIAGSSFDIVEAQGGKLEIFDCAIRGLAITGPVDESVASSSGRDITLGIDSSKVADVWIGDGLTGGATIRDSLVLQLINLSDNFRVDVQGVAYTGLLNVAKDVIGKEVHGVSMYEFRDRDLAENLRYRMDYRSVPGRAELDRFFGPPGDASG